MSKADNTGSIIPIPYARLSSETLESLMTEFVMRDATDYGKTEVPLERKIEQVRQQLQSGKAVILFDESTQTCNIVSRSDPQVKDLGI
ncbi:MAG TPA: YheU family protein [Syntrophales bacterium]|nr:YheU family protein [Syntrophales bacterium]HPQ44211.1 YheU family protein [Syntrophales bacterium]